MLKDEEISKLISRLYAFDNKKKSQNMCFPNQYGYFQNDGREFVVTSPHTPGLWANFLTNGRYTALVTPTGGGYSWEQESAFNRVLREHPLRHLHEDQPGRYVYIKDLEDQDFWSATYQPVKKGREFQAVHSLGYTKSGLVQNDIQSNMTYFIPFAATHEIWWLKLKNLSARRRTLRLFTYSEFVLGNYKSDILENSFTSLFMKGEKYNQSLLFRKTILQTKQNMVDTTYDKIGFIATNHKFNNYELSRRDFVGFGQSLEAPRACGSQKLSSRERAGEPLVGCIEIDIELAPGQEKELFFAVGTAKTKKEIDKVSRSLTSPKVTAEYQQVHSFWDRYCRKVWIKTPDEGLNIWFNWWLKYQTYFNAHWSEMDSFYIGGGGGFGFRDTAQHIWGVLPFEREVYLKQLRYLLKHQYPDGSVPHGISVFSGKAVISSHSDDSCWLAFAILNYLEETNDLSFLEEEIAFANSEQDMVKKHTGSVLHHLIRATDYTLRTLSERGIPQIQVADWNDALSSGPLGKGESFLVAGLLAFNLKRLVTLLERLKRLDKVQEYSYAYKRLAESVITFGWDGDWFLRATQDHQKLPIGSQKNDRGKIFLDSNTWLCMSDLAGIYTKKTLTSLWEKLMTRCGAELFTPAYDGKKDRHLGVISQFVPGSKENAAIFLHANAWFLIALSRAGETKKAWELLKRINPVYCTKNIDEYKVEPYVLPEFVFGRESDKFGEGSFTWVTGSAEWFLRGILDNFLGLRPEYDRLVFDPKVPKDWEFVVEREFQGKRYRAEYKKGKKKLTVIGK